MVYEVRTLMFFVIAILLTGIAGFPGVVQANGIALRAARMLDVKTGEVIKDATVLVQDGRIVAAGDNVAFPPEWEVHDLGDVTLMPGLIDAHSHLLLDINPAVSNEQDFARMMNERGEAQRILAGARHAREYLMAGFTTVRDVGHSGRYSGLALADAVSKGWLPGPRIISCGRALSPPGGQLGEALRDDSVDREFREVRGAEDARQAVKDVLEDGAACIKLIIEAYGSLSRPEVEAAVAAAHEAGVRVTAHAFSPYAATMAINAGADSIDHGYFLNDAVLREMAAKNVALIPTDISRIAVCELFFPETRCTRVPDEFRYLIDNEQRRLLEAHAAGVQLAAGSDMFYRWPGRTRGEAAAGVFRAYAEAGLPLPAIVKAATIGAANVLGIDDETGSLEPGKLADVIAVAGNPLDDAGALRNVRFVMRAGEIYRNDLD